MAQPMKWTLYFFSFLYVGMGLGLIGCSRDVTHDSPDSILADQEFLATAEGDSLTSYKATVRLVYDTNLMNECVGCCGQVYYDGADWGAMRNANIRLNDVPLVFDENASIIHEDDFTISHVEYRLPEDAELDLQPGDTLRWTVDVDADVESIWLGGLEDRELPVSYMPVLPEDGAHISQADGLTIEQSVPGGTQLRIALYRDEARTRTSRLTDAMITDYRPDVNLYISPSYIGETLWLVVNQNYTYEAVRRIVIDE